MPDETLHRLHQQVMKRTTRPQKRFRMPVLLAAAAAGALALAFALPSMTQELPKEQQQTQGSLQTYGESANWQLFVHPISSESVNVEINPKSNSKREDVTVTVPGAFSAGGSNLEHGQPFLINKMRISGVTSLTFEIAWTEDRQRFTESITLQRETTRELP